MVIQTFESNSTAMIVNEPVNGHVNQLINNHSNSFTPRSIVKSSTRKDTIEPKLIDTKSVTPTPTIVTNPKVTTINGNCYNNPFQQSLTPYHNYQQHSNYASYHHLNSNNQTTGLTSSSLSPTLFYQRKGSFYILLSLLILGIVLLILIAVGSIIVYITYSQRAKTRITIERKDHCLSIGCSFGADCVLDEDGLEPYCRCTHQCDARVEGLGEGGGGFNHEYVCGNDNVTYPSSCHLRLTSCQLQQTIYVKHEGACYGVQSKCIDSDCKYGSICSPVKTGHGSECRCPEKCLDYPEVVYWLREKYPTSQSESLALTNETVCGIDGQDYENFCQLKKISCLKSKPISIKYYGSCDPCSTMMCPSDEICQLDDERRPFCSCNNTCSTMDIVDSHHSNFNNKDQSQGDDDDDNSHHNNRNGLTIMTPTTSTTGSTSTITTIGSISSSSSISTENKTTSSICGSDGNLYQSECSLLRESCVQKIDIKPLPSSNCIQGHHPCHKSSCSYGGKCIVDKFGSTKCICQQCEKIYKPICGSNRITYDSVCHMLRDSCNKKVNLTITYSGPCENYQPTPILTNGLTNNGFGGSVNNIGQIGSNRSIDLLTNSIVPCTPDNCRFGGFCVQAKDSDHQMNSICQCPQCSEESEAVCGSNGITYLNECDLKKASCQNQKDIYISHKGPCRSCDTIKHSCKYYATCEINMYGIHECVCPQVCLRQDQAICGSNGVTYDNECELRVRSCLARTEITVAHIGPCDMCQKVNCKNGAQCEGGRCVCPSSCPDPIYEPICANDGNTYPNLCEMRKNACLNDKDLRSLFYGQCEVENEDEPASSDDNGSINQLQSNQISKQYNNHNHRHQHSQFKQRDFNSWAEKISDQFSSPSPLVSSLTSNINHNNKPCQRLKCNFGGICSFNSRGRPFCECNLNCPSMSSYDKVNDEPVCGSDGRYYDNLCSLKEESCRRQVEIKSVNSDQCNLSTSFTPSD